MVLDSALQVPRNATGRVLALCEVRGEVDGVMRGYQELLHSFEGMYGDDSDVKMLKMDVVITRKAHFCPGYWKEAGHDIPAGTKAVRERGLLEAKWVSCYTCESCIKDWNGQICPERVNSRC